MPNNYNCKRIKSNHDWIPTGKLNQFKCSRCGIVKERSSGTNKYGTSGSLNIYYRNGIVVENTGCIK